MHKAGCWPRSRTSTSGVGLLLFALVAAACGSSSSPTPPASAPKSSNYHGTLTSTNYAATPLDMALTATGGGAAQPVGGSYSTGNGITGQVQGTVTGSLDGGSFAGTLTYNTSPLGGTNCNGSGSFTGSVSAGGIDWSSPGFHSNCPGDPTGIRVQAPIGGSGPTPTPTPPPSGVNLTGTWSVGGQPVFVLTQSGSIVTGTDVPPTLPPIPGGAITFSGTISGGLSGNTLTATDTTSTTVTVPGTIFSCSATNSITAQVTSTTMTGTYTSLITFACTPSFPGFSVPAQVPQSFTATKQ